MRRTAADRAAVSAVPAMVQDVIRSPGHSLDPGVRSRMELGLGHDFSRVRVHADPRAHQAAAAVDALAYSVGPHVVFGAGQYAPETPAGTRLLAHELAHVAQQESAPVPADLTLDGGPMDPLEIEADRAASHVAEQSPHGSVRAGAGPAVVHRRVRPENVSCRTSGLTNPNLTGAEAVAAIEAADADAIVLAQGAEQALDDHLAAAQAGDPVDAAFDTILREELGLTFTNAAHIRLIRQQRDRFRRVRQTLEGGDLRYLCRGGRVGLVGCQQGTCGGDFAFSCPGNRLVVLCQAFWDTPAERSATILHEPFHIWFDMASHADSALRRADASCFESFALRVAGRPALASCVAHTDG